MSNENMTYEETIAMWEGIEYVVVKSSDSESNRPYMVIRKEDGEKDYFCTSFSKETSANKKVSEYYSAAKSTIEFCKKKILEGV